MAGTGSFALEAIEYARAAGHDVVALLELVDQSRIGSEIHGLPVVGLEVEAGVAVIGLGGDRLTSTASRWARAPSWPPASSSCGASSAFRRHSRCFVKPS